MNSNPSMGGGLFSQMLSRLQSNPIQFILQSGHNIPQNIGNDPVAITQYLMNSGQFSQAQYNQAVQDANNLFQAAGNFRR